VNLNRVFDVREYAFSDKAAELGIYNRPDNGSVASLKNLHSHIVVPLLDVFGRVQINSGFRCQELNARLGSSSTSQHTRGEAVDIEVPLIGNDGLFNYIFTKLPFDQLIREHPGKQLCSGWVHVSWVAQCRGNALLCVAGKYTSQGVITDSNSPWRA